MKTIPSEADWGDPFTNPTTLDEQYAYRHFAGKSLEEAQALFAEDALYYMEDLLYMPPRCFRYYVLAVCRYLMSDASEGDCDGASCFLSHVQFRPNILQGTPSLQVVLDTITHISSRQEFYDASYECYGSFAERGKQAIHTLGG